MKIGIVSDLHINKEKISEFEKFLSSLTCDILLIAGDIASSKQDEIELAFKSINKIIPHIKTLIVFGNHDYYSSDHFTNVRELTLKRNDLCSKYNIHYLQNNKFETNTISIYGFDGWYKYLYNLGTIDQDMMPINSGEGELTPFQHLQKEERIAVDYILKNLDQNQTNIVLTHFNLVANPGYERMSGNSSLFEILTPEIDFLVYGHTHKEEDIFVNECRIINPGADYKELPSLNKYYKEIVL